MPGGCPPPERASGAPPRSLRLLIPPALLAAAIAAEPAGGAPWRFEGPDPRLEAVDGVHTLVLPAGVVGHRPGGLLIADALRATVRGGEDAAAWALWAEGGIIYVMERGGGQRIRITADRLGLRGGRERPEAGDAWQVGVRIDLPEGRTFRAEAARARLADDRIVLSEVRFDLGHGGLLAVEAPSAVIHLRPLGPDGRLAPRPRNLPWLPEKDDALHRNVDGIEISGATVLTAGVPTLWLPWAYRDFRYDWPWTYYEAGTSRRLGWFARAFVGSDLPALFGWKPRIEVGGDHASAAGGGFSLRGRWTAEDGQGEAFWQERPREEIRGGADNRDGIGSRRARLVDIEQRLRLPGGAVSGRWVELPGPDPAAPDGTIASPDRYRADHDRRDLERRPLARRFAAAAWGGSLIELAVDTQRNPHPQRTASERWWGVAASLPCTAVADLGGAALAVEADGRIADLRRPRTDTRAVRMDGAAGLALVRWIGGFNLDLRGGWRGLSYHDGTIAGVEQDRDVGRSVAEGAGSLGLRLESVYAPADAPPIVHALTPRVGVEAISDGRGRRLPAYGFGDAGDRLDEDRRWLTTGVLATVVQGDRSFRADAVARWAVRSRERSYISSDGDQAIGRTPLAEVAWTADGRPGESIGVGGSGTWDARIQRWRTLDGWTWWQAHRRLRLRGEASDDPAAEAGRRLAYRPGALWRLERYAIDAETEHRPGGRWADGFVLSVMRRMVDGDVTFTAAWDYAPDGGMEDRRFGISLSLGGAGDERRDPQRSWAVR